MAELTKEWLKQTIAEYEANRDELPFGLDTNSAIELQAFKLALASLEAEPVAYIFKHPAGKLFWALTDESNKDQADVIPVYAAAPASVVPDNASEPLAYAYKELTPEIMRNHLAVFERYGLAPNDSSTTIQALRIALDGIERSDAMLHGAEPVSQTYNLPELIEGMEVSIDVSTCDADLGNRYFGTVTEVLELDTAKNGYILLVQDAKPNFKTAGNSPVTPDGWISCSERMPDSKTGVLVAREFGRKGDWRMKWATYIPWHPDTNDGWLIPGASWKPSHWMPLPEPPQEEK
ncbi:DUF551 domain-containing protein [Salmonella enterica]|nr:DUF551 domain-containing protein [Salmonella enterica]EDH9298545.1 DUF551 domain-containing protein [Salmonella enterica subsp. enterica serovar Saintpaul]EDI9266628.1 DUF551 domain-containing protein [Salmonella enterica subsp. enterica serovar Saintpaul]EDK9023586.1 DUF551 domain-containing protein [Salmonella enterica]EDM9206203.1 DUF551 domain-containing protein [Salmonella enterica]KAJ99335.1 hypothetical protein N925_16050 [Salmonella enterica subsp. enterica serovar 9,12:l,v:- str. 9